MQIISLTKVEKSHLEQQHKRVRDGRIRDRLKAVLLRSEGWSVTQIAQALRLHESSITRHLDDYLAESKLSPNNGGSAGYLSEKQIEELVAHR